MESSCAPAALKEPLLDLEEVSSFASTSSDSLDEDELDMVHHVRRIPVENNKDDCSDESEDPSEWSWTDSFVMWFILPTLLLSQFGMAFMMHDERTSNMSWTIVNVAIALFVMTAWLYRHTCHDANIKKIGILLMPEILMDVVLGLVLFDQVSLGFMVLLFGMLCLSTFVVVSTAAFLYSERGEGQLESDKEATSGRESKVVQVV